MKLPIPKGLERRLRPVMRRGEDFLRTWEWSWTSAFIAGMIISFIGLTTMAVIPSWMLYFSDSTFGTDNRLIITVRDLVVTGWTFTWMGIFIIAAYFVQKARRRVRGEKQSERYSGGYR